jgi:hypothetical protein
MTPHEFAIKWQKAQLTERAGYQQHFLDLCDLLGQPHPAEGEPVRPPAPRRTRSDTPPVSWRPQGRA